MGVVVMIWGVEVVTGCGRCNAGRARYEGRGEFDGCGV